MCNTILLFIKFNNGGTWSLNGPRCLFHLFCCNTRHIFELLCVYEPGFNTDKYGTDTHSNRPICKMWDYRILPGIPLLLFNLEDKI